MNRRIVIIAVLLMAVPAGVVFAQFGEDIQPENLGQDVAQQRLQEISVTKFEEGAFFRVNMSSDYGITEFRRFEGRPAAKEPIAAEQNIGFSDADNYVLGVRADFYRRGRPNIIIQPERPISIPGLVKTLSVWVVGRNANHELSILLEDIHGTLKTVRMGELNFSGWRKMTVAVPPRIEQQEPRRTDRTGLRFRGFSIRPAMMQTYGSYYVYFDDLRAVTDLFGEEVRGSEATDDMVDGW